MIGLIKEVNRELNTSGNLCVFAVDWKLNEHGQMGNIRVCIGVM